MVFSLFLKASKIFRSILEMLGNLRVIRKSLSQFVSSLTADHYFWCSGGVPCCFEGVSGYYEMFQGCSGVVPGCSGLFRWCSRDVPGCSGVLRVLQTPGGKGETKNRAWYNSSTERLPPTFFIDWHSTKQPIKISSACTILGMQISHNGN